MIKTIKYSKDVDLEKELARSQFSYDDVNETVESILKDVRARGDKALIEYTEKFDGVKLENLEVTEEEIKKAYRQLAKEHHPDKFVNASDSEKKFHENKMKEINEAYENLKI